MRFTELFTSTQIGESTELNSVTKRYINSQIQDKLYRHDQTRPYRLVNVLDFLRRLKDGWKQSGDPSTFEVADVLEPYRQDIINYLKDLFVGSSDSYLPLYQAALLFNAGVHWPEVVELFESHKESIIKRVLMLVKYGRQASDVDSWLTALRAVGVNWPEIDMIEKSRNADKPIQENNIEPQLSHHGKWMLKQIEDNNFTILPSYLVTYSYPAVIVTALNDKKQDVLNSVNYLINKPAWLHAVQLIQGLKHQGLQWPELDAILNDIKTPCIKYMLRVFKSMEYEKDDLEYIVKIVKSLKKSGVDWPELKIINDTAETELDRIPPEEEEEEYDEPDDDYHGYRYNY